MGIGATALLLPFFLAACGEPPPRPVPSGPNVLMVVWDTARADRLSLYGHDRPTTPRLDAWAAGARVFENAVSPAGYTLASHGSLFTGLLPSEHCAHNGNPRLDDRYTTLAEQLTAAGYRTFLFSANPHITASPNRNFAQGFEIAEHPWSPAYEQQALELVTGKLTEEDRSSELPERLEASRHGEGRITPWNIKAAGELAERALLDWIENGDPERPWFAFLNYMEAHRPLIPPRAYRELMMSADDVTRSYRVDRSFLSAWEYSFRLRNYTREDLELTRATYDSALRELDDLFGDLLEALEAEGHMEDTVVIMTSDHGEHLGEQHMLGHQYSVFQPLLRVPLVLHAPARVDTGRDSRPVMNYDLFPTVLELAGVELPNGSGSRAVSLLAPSDGRLRFAEEPAHSPVAIRQVQERHPRWDPAPFERRLRTLIDADTKYIWASDGRHALYDLGRDPWEDHDLLKIRPALAQALEKQLAGYFATLAHCTPTGHADEAEGASPDERRMLRALGYLAEEEEPAE
jgi:arylsulfatase A-like enzyme